MLINAKKFEDEFGQKKKEAVQVVKRDEKKIESKPSMLLGPRQQNINIVLNKLRLPALDISEALITYNEKVLTIGVCELLL